MRIIKLVKNLFLKSVRKIFPNGLKFSKKTLILGISVLVLCLPAFWTFSTYRASKSIDLLKSSDWQVKEKATNDLSKFGKPAVGPLISALKDENWDIRWRAAYSLGNIGDSQAIEPLAEALKDEDRRVRYRAVEALEKIGGSRASESLISALMDEDIDVQERVTEALVIISKPAVESLILALKHEDNKCIRMKSAQILGEIGDSRAIEPLIDALKDESIFVRRKATHALVKIGKSAVKSLILALNNENEIVQERAEEALTRMTNQNFGMDSENWQKWWDGNKDKFSTQDENK